jgi:hypothetical protein
MKLSDVSNVFTASIIRAMNKPLMKNRLGLTETVGTKKNLYRTNGDGFRISFLALFLSSIDPHPYRAVSLRTSETSVYLNETVRRCIPEGITTMKLRLDKRLATVYQLKKDFDPRR